MAKHFDLFTARSGQRLLAVIAALFVATALLAQRDRERAEALYQKRDFRAAAEEFLRYLDRRPEDYRALLLLGLSLEQIGDAAQAEKVFLEAVRRRPDDGLAHLHLARSLYRQGRHQHAARWIEVARERGADAQRADYLEGLVLDEQGRNSSALEAYRRAGDAADARVKAAAVLMRMQRPREALQELEEGPGTDDAHYQRALAHVALGDRRAAVVELRQAGDHRQAKALLRRLRRLPDDEATAREPEADLIPVRFVERGEEAGLDFVLENSPTPRKHLPETMAGGLAVFDADQDGLLDIFFANGAPTPEMEKTGTRYSNRLYRNLGGLRFEDVTARAGLEGEGFSIGAAAADYDNDGDVDLFVFGVNRNLLYRNRGDGVFDEVSTEAGVAGAAWASGAAWLDYDNDGLLDLFVANYLEWDPRTAPVCRDSRSGVRTYCHPKFFPSQANQLFRNRGDGTFEEVSDAAGVAAHRGKAMSVALADVDLDGDLDIFTPNDAVPNFLFVNSGGTFEESGFFAGVALKNDGKAVSSMGAAFGDVDGDGRPDLIFTALPGETFPHFRNEGEGIFLDRTAASGVAGLSRPHGGWGVALADFNNDGGLDVMTANSHVMDNAERFSAERYEQPSSLWLNRGDGGFVDATEPAGLASNRAAHRGLAVADFDRDGLLDAVVTVLGERPELWRNVSSGSGCWLRFRFRGDGGNRDGIGVRVLIRGQAFTYTTTAGYASSVHGPLHIGLGGCDVPVEAEILWPGGGRQTLEITELNRTVEVPEPPPQAREVRPTHEDDSIAAP